MHGFKTQLSVNEKKKRGDRRKQEKRGCCCFVSLTAQKKREGKPEHTAVAGKAIKRVCVCVYVCDSSSCNTLDYDESGKRKKVKGQHHNVRYARQDKAHMDIENKKKTL